MKSFDALHRNPTTSPTNITVQAVKPGQWRILDNRLPAENIAALLGVVDYDGDSYVITLIGHPGETQLVPSLAAVPGTVHTVTGVSEPVAGHWVQVARLTHTS